MTTKSKRTEPYVVVQDHISIKPPPFRVQCGEIPMVVAESRGGGPNTFTQKNKDGKIERREEWRRKGFGSGRSVTENAAMFQGMSGAFGGSGSKASTGFGQWYSDIQLEAKEAELAELSEAEVVGEASTTGWSFWLANEKKTDGSTQSLLPIFLRTGSRQQVPPNEADNVVMGMPYHQRFKGFVMALFLSVVFFCLAFFVGLPMLVVRPHKFVLTFTLGSVLFMASFAMLKGPSKHLRSMMGRDRLPFSLAYVGSMAGTLYACLVLRSYVMVVAFSVVQLLALAWYFVSFVPGGSRGMTYLVSAIHKTARYTVRPVVEVCRRAMCVCIRAGS